MLCMLCIYNCLLNPVGSVRAPRPTSNLGASLTSPLHEKLGTLMDYLSHHHMLTIGGQNEAECSAKMIKICNLFGGGIELD